MSAQQSREELKPILPPSVAEMTTIREWSQHLRNLADMMERFLKDLSPKNIAAHQRMIGRIESHRFIADLFQLQVREKDTAILDVIGPLLPDLVLPHIQAFVAVNNQNVKMAEKNGVNMPTLDKILGQRHAEPTELDEFPTTGDLIQGANGLD